MEYRVHGHVQGFHRLRHRFVENLIFSSKLSGSENIERPEASRNSFKDYRHRRKHRRDDIWVSKFLLTAGRSDDFVTCKFSAQNQISIN